MLRIWLLTVSFFLIGLGAFGGGLVTVPLIQHELVDSRQWLTHEEMSQIVAVAEMTPGPIAVNAATFVGYKVAGVPGSIIATLAVILPSVLMMIPLSRFMHKTRTDPRMQRLWSGVRAGVLSLLLFAIWSYGRGVVTHVPEFIMAAGAFALLLLLDRRVHPIAFIVAGGLLGVFIF
jgi:chromate transporter